MRKLSAWLLLAFGIAAAAEAEWAVTSAQSEFSAGKGVEHRHLVVRSGAGETTLELAIFSAKSATLRVIDNPDGNLELASAMRGSNCIAGANGGYFDPQFAPVGLRVIDGATTSPFVRARLLTGVLASSRDHGVEIVRAGEFSRNRKLDAAVECGPFLVDLGVRVRGLDNRRNARRTFAAVARGGRAALGYCEGSTLAELGGILSSGRLAGGFTVWRAMNLDGGSSSAFWFRRAEESDFVIPEQKNVRDFVGIVAK